MKNWISFCVALLLCAGVLLYVSADINEGHGPGYTVEQGEEGSHS